MAHGTDHTLAPTAAETGFDFTISPPAVALPEGSCDCHFHVFGPKGQYQFVDDRAYTPMAALPSDAVAVFQTLGLERGVLIQPSVYGTDNQRLLDAMSELPFQTRGVVVVDPDMDEAGLTRMHEQGVRGVRLNGIDWTSDQLISRFTELETVISIVAEMGWHLECYLGSQAYPALDDILGLVDIDIVLDHCGGVFSTTESVRQRFEAYKHFQSLGRIWVKLSGLYRIKEEMDRLQGQELVLGLVDIMPDRLLWASDWPHTPDHTNGDFPSNDPQPFRSIDAGALVSETMDWIGDPTVVQKIFVDNPSSIYGF